MSLMGNLFGQGSGQTGGILGMFSNVAEMIQKFQQFSRNPVQSLLQMNPNLNIPQEYMYNSQATVEYLINSGQMTREQYDQFCKTAKQIQPLLPRF